MVKAAALVPLEAVRGSAQNSAIKVGLIGAGSRGQYTASMVAKNPRAKIAAICDVADAQIEKARQRTGAADAKAYKNFEDLLASDVDAVMIATPVYLHPEHFEAAVKSGKHIYMEKPAGLDVAGCKRVMRAADGAARTVDIAFGFQQRYGGVYVKAKELLDSRDRQDSRSARGVSEIRAEGRRARSSAAAQRAREARAVEAVARDVRRSDRRNLRP
jgi:predicted dehydrogenase